MVKGQNLEEVKEGKNKGIYEKENHVLKFFGNCLCMICVAWSRTVNLLLTNMYVRPASVIRTNFSIEGGQPQPNKPEHYKQIILGAVSRLMKDKIMRSSQCIWWGKLWPAQWASCDEMDNLVDGERGSWSALHLQQGLWRNVLWYPYMCMNKCAYNKSVQITSSHCTLTLWRLGKQATELTKRKSY